LTIPVFPGKITPENLANALKNVRIKAVQEWLDINIGESIFTLRKKTFGSK
jgi:hypothetical protein